MKKILSFVLGLACLVSLVACGGKTNDPSKAGYEHDEDAHWKLVDDVETDVELHDFKETGNHADYDHDGHVTYTCDICGYSFEDYEEQLIHEYEETYSPCEEDREHYHYKKCVDEGYESLYTDKAEHDFELIEVPSTFEEKGYELYRCKDCVYSYKWDTYDYYAPHLYSYEYYYDENKHWNICLDPGYEDLKLNEGPHNMEMGIFYDNPDEWWDSPGYYLYTCATKGCDYKKIEYFGVGSYAYEDSWTYNESEHWHACISYNHETDRKDVSSHVWESSNADGWVITSEATEYENGSRERTCSICGYHQKQSIASSALGDTKFLNLRYDGDEEAYYISGYKGEPENIRIPKEYNGVEIHGIDDNAFNGCKSINTITFASDSVIKYFGKESFASSSIEKINNMPSNLTNIGESAFNNCENLQTITIGKGVTTIGSSAFSGCTSLTAVTLRATNLTEADSVFVGATSLEQLGIANNVTNIPNNFCRMATALSKVEYESASESNLTRIGKKAFYGTALKSITLTKSLKEVGTGAFAKCEKLTKMNYHAADCKCENMFFENNSARNKAKPSELIKQKRITLTIGKDVEKIPKNAFYRQARIKDIDFQSNSSLKEIGESAFEKITNLMGSTSNQTLILPRALEKIGKQAFAEMGTLRTITIYNNVTEIGEKAFFKNTNLKTIKFQGTKEEWEAIKKGNNWVRSANAGCVISCKDGDIPISNYQ